MRQPGAPIGDYKSGASPWALAAIAMIEASAAAAAERAKRRDADKVYQFLDRVAVENDRTFETGDHLFAFYATSAYCRRQRAQKLRFIRSCMIQMGRCNTRGKLLESCKALRREELYRRAYEDAMRGMADWDNALNNLRTMEIAS